MKTKRISRVIKLILLLLSGKSLKVHELSKTLEVSRRTIFRDLQELSKAGLAIHYDQRNGTHSLNNKSNLKVPNLTREEALGLFLLAYKGSKCLNFPLKKEGISAAMKIEAALPKDLKKYCNDFLCNVSIKKTKNTKDEIDQEFFNKIQAAINKKQILYVECLDYHSNKYVSKKLGPLNLLYCNMKWYLIGKSNDREETEIIDVQKIRFFEPCKKLSITNEKFDLYEHLGRAWAIICEGRLFNVKLRFNPEIADEIVSYKWHETQTENLLEDGSVIIEFRLDGINEIVPWILSFGDKVEVLQPQSLKERINQIVNRMASTANEPVRLVQMNNIAHMLHLEKAEKSNSVSKSSI